MQSHFKLFCVHDVSWTLIGGIRQRINFSPNNHNNMGSFVSGIASAVSAYFETDEEKEALCLYRSNAWRLDCTMVPGFSDECSCDAS